jgi:hypothetical protein
VLKDNDIAISMDGKGCWRDDVVVERLWRSVKYEEVCLKAAVPLASCRHEAAVRGAVDNASMVGEWLTRPLGGTANRPVRCASEHCCQRQRCYPSQQNRDDHAGAGSAVDDADAKERTHRHMRG